jgi:tetratricopeptide (TPR) repeat protein
MRRFFIIIALLALSATFVQAQSEPAEQPMPTEAQEQPQQGQPQEQQPLFTMKPSPNNPEALWDAAAAAYNAADYLTAIEYYTTILDGGRHSAELYYNLANAYFKREQVGEALLNYNRALRLKPADEDIRHNLAFAEQSTKDSIEQIPEFFLSTWMRSVRNLMGGNAWTILSIVMLALALAMALLYLLAQPLSMRKTGFYSMALFGLLFIITTSFAWSARTEATAQRDAIIMSSAASIKSSPDSNSTELFVLHEGTKVRVGEVMDKWAEVRIADGRKGWIEIDRIERI